MQPATGGSSGVTQGQDADVELLTSPLRRGLVSRAFIIGGPVGLAVAIVVSLWVSYLHVRHTISVHVEPQWVAGEQLALRAQISAEYAAVSLAGARGEAWVEQAGQRYPLTTLSATPRPGLLQSVFEVPSLTPGAATLHLELAADELEPREESIPIEVVQEAAAREGTPMVAGSTLQYGDDSDPQPPGFHIDVLPAGRLLSEFDNELWIRVMHEDGRPYAGRVEVRLHGGEFAEERAATDTSVLLEAGRTDPLGLLPVRGRLGSEVLRLGVEVLAESEERKVLGQRRVRLVSFAGAIWVDAAPLAVAPGAEVEVTAQALRPKMPIFVDVFDGRGRWVDTVRPPFDGGEPPRPWRLETPPSVVQLQAYHFTHAASEATAVARVQILEGAAASTSSLEPLVALHRAGVDLARVDRTYDAALERKYLDHLARIELDPVGVDQAREFLLRTAPLRIHALPLQLATRERDVEALAALQHRWTIGLRIFLLGGGGLFLLAMTVMMVRAHAAAAEQTLQAIERLGDADATLEVAEDLARARRSAFARGVAVIAVMAAALFGATVMLESLLWVF